MTSYSEETYRVAIELWGIEAEKARKNIEATAEATDKISKHALAPQQEPVTKLRHGETR